MKKILFLGGLSSGGAEHQMVIVAKLLKQDGYDVTYLCDESSSFFQKDLEEAGVPILRIKENRIIDKLRLNTPYITRQVGKVLQKGCYDTVISFVALWNFENCWFAKRKRTAHRAITGIRNNRDQVFLAWREKFYTRFERNAFRKVSNSNAARKRFAENFPYLTDKLMTINNIVDLPAITTSYTCCRDGKVHIIIPASYRAVKNPMGMLRGVALLNEEERSRLHLDWYGNIKSGKACYEEMTQFIKQSNLNDTVKLHDATTDIDNRINEADAVGLFSTSEGLPNAICEGMMLGKPVIMTKVSDYDILVDETNGFLCDADNPETIKKALSAIVKLSESKLGEMGASSKMKAMALFSKEVVLKQWKQII